MRGSRRRVTCGVLDVLKKAEVLGTQKTRPFCVPPVVSAAAGPFGVLIRDMEIGTIPLPLGPPDAPAAWTDSDPAVPRERRALFTSPVGLHRPKSAKLTIDHKIFNRRDVHNENRQESFFTPS